MKKKISPQEAIGFIESFQMMLADKNEETQMISLRVPGNILNAYKTIAKRDGKKYQSLINQALQEYLKTIK